MVGAKGAKWEMDWSSVYSARAMMRLGRNAAAKKLLQDLLDRHSDASGLLAELRGE